ncbi:MAG: DNA polymerase Y family protein [Candidatus Eisenbacteria bacterium]|uniref:DNA polymerase Y family protein n=1 Tax=Eiseniibacteriota bacterium TaxID=2212470 RepID=A0A956SCG8_UNCEI|nr:DNA polymerase Y family protein [Candidatus Eisenbacteria bacterium]MCB9466246.1 DNA polymerase Y family protein [Candidatus Eisenbacteria bacterium]
MVQRGSSDGDMARVACVALPAFPLQLLLKKHPDWNGLPAAVVDHDKPQGILLWVNERARAHRILPGMRYAAGLSLTRELRAGVIGAEEIQEGVAALEAKLGFYSPEVEPSSSEPGVFWIGANGLSLLYPSLVRLARLIREGLVRENYEAEVAVGFSRFGTYAAARCGAGFLKRRFGGGATGRRSAARRSDPAAGSSAGSSTTPSADSNDHVLVFRSPRAEITVVRHVPIDRVGFDPDLRDTLAKLAIHDLGGFADLPPEGLQKRFSPEVLRLHKLLRGELWDPLQPNPIYEPLRDRFLFDDPENDRERLLAQVVSMLRGLLGRLASGGDELASLRIELAFEHDGLGDRTNQGEKKATPRREELLRPAKPTLDEEQIVQLLRLRLESLSLPAGVTEVELEVRGARVEREQLELFGGVGPRDLEAATRAFARLRAELGESVVVRARLKEGHLPEARFAWEPMGEQGEPNARRVHLRPLVRRFLESPWALPSRPRHEPDGWLVTGIEGGAAEEILGPYVVSGGWWHRAVHREYHYIRTDKGKWLWVYYDRERRRWYLQGEVE